MRGVRDFVRNREGTSVEQAVLVGGALAVVAAVASLVKHQTDNASSVGDTAKSKAEAKINNL